MTGTSSKEKPIKNWGWNFFKIIAGVESVFFFIRSWKMKILNIYSAQNIHNTPLLTQKTTKLFFPSTIIEWNSLDPNLRKSENFSVFKRNILKFIRPSPNSVYSYHNRREICLVTRLRPGLSHLREHKFKHSF